MASTRKETLRLRMFIMGVKQQDVAARAGLSCPMVCSVLAGRNRASSRLVDAFAALLDRSPMWIRRRIAEHVADTAKQPDTRPAAVQACDAALLEDKE